MKRAVLLVLSLVTGCVGLPLPQPGGDTVTADISTVDETGRPVPWVTVAASWTPYPSFEKAAGFPRLGPGDVERMIRRNPEAWEYMNRFVGPVMFLKFTGLSDPLGQLPDTIAYEEAARSPWPEELTVTYGAYRDGYEPTTSTIKVRRHDKHFKVTLVLRSAKSDAADLPDYARALYKARHELADWRRNEDVSRANQRRLEEIRENLESAALAAARAGDRRSASKIMYWVGYMPEVLTSKGKLVGFSQTNAESPRNCEAFKRSAEYDPDNVHVQAQYLLIQYECATAEERRGTLTWSGVKRLRRQLMDRAISLDRVAGGKLWPSFHNSLANDYGYYNMEAKKIEKLEWLRLYEPAWRDPTYYDSAIRIAKEQMAKALRETR